MARFRVGENEPLVMRPMAEPFLSVRGAFSQGGQTGEFSVFGDESEAAQGQGIRGLEGLG